MTIAIDPSDYDRTTWGTTRWGERIAREDAERSAYLREKWQQEREAMRRGVTTCADCGCEVHFTGNLAPRLCRECRKADDRRLARKRGAR